LAPWPYIGQKPEQLIICKLFINFCDACFQGGRYGVAIVTVSHAMWCSQLIDVDTNLLEITWQQGAAFHKYGLIFSIEKSQSFFPCSSLYVFGQGCPEVGPL